MASDSGRPGFAEHSMLEGLPTPILIQVFSQVSGKDCAALSCSCSSFRKVLSAEASIWALCCEREFLLSPEDIEVETASLLGTSPTLTSCSLSGAQADSTSIGKGRGRGRGISERSQASRETSIQLVSGESSDQETVGQQIQAQMRTRQVREVYQTHFIRGKKYPGMYKRALHVWSGLVKWTQQNIPTLSRSILSGVSEAELDKAERTLGVTFPASLRALYILRNGQLTPYDALIGASEEASATGLRCPVGAGSSRPNASPSPQEIYHTCFHGLLGSYSFYDHVVSTRFLPLQLSILWTKKIRQFLSRHKERVRASASTRGSSQAHGVEQAPDLGREAGGGMREGEGEGIEVSGPTGEVDSESWAHRVLFAASFMKIQGGFHFTKMFFVDCRDGNVYVGGSDLLAGGALLRCTPPAPPSEGTHDSGLIRWLEEYVHRLDSGMYGVRIIQEDYPFKGICLFPELPPFCSEAITRRVRVRASALFIPEALPLGPPLPSNPVVRRPEQVQEAERTQSCFAYSIRMSLLTVEEASRCGAEGELGDLSMQSCQLKRRHWVIEEGGERAADVSGEAVVGKYPLLRQGEEEFVYQSCTQMSADKGSIEGDFSFVPGSMRMPAGPQFEATVARFMLQIPDYIY